ncbi:hypothetical protein HHI36_023475 [Cryptolaemus montrouzieri]|uniref:Uncharacterized protein n=1 Tax=Cryptolaemus montrouzieri TaxID=559131 RepID=A0ABD2PGM6_9CUCU
MIPPTQKITDEERQCEPKRYKLDLLKDPSVAFLYKLRLSQKLTQIDDSRPTKLYDGLVKSIHQADEKTENTTREFSKEVNKEIIKRKYEFWDAKCEEVDKYLGSSRSRKSWRLLKNLRTNENSRTNLQPISMSEWELYYKQ